TTPDVRTIEWWKLTEEQFQQRTQTFSSTNRTLARTIWEGGPDFFSRIGSLNDVDTAVLSQRIAGETSAEGWFIYFFKEAKAMAHVGGTAAQRDLLRIAQTYLRKGPTGVEFKEALTRVDQSQLRKDMTDLLQIGFHRFSGFGEGYDPSDCSDAALLQYRRTGQVYQDIDFRWRADSRPFSAVRDTDGFRTKADSEGYARANGMREPYHPFSDPSTRKYLWFRRMQADNCLYTVISIGQVAPWKSFLPFPKVEKTLDKRLFSATDRAPLSTKYSERFALCRVNGGTESIKLPVTETWLYMFLLTGFVLETGRIQEHVKVSAFPEEGVKEIPLRDIFGAVKFYRFHHGPDDADGFTALPEPGGMLQHQNALFQKAKYSERGFTLLQDSFKEVAESGPISVKWSATGFSDIDKAFNFKGRKIEVLGLSLQR
ncbi:MAG TPA: hypothetical protein VNH46_01630, partial [Gemmatimonadales bacterium]|nr:hypothetical protein [Gemmatimonadales bacterium]